MPSRALPVDSMKGKFERPPPSCLPRAVYFHLIYIFLQAFSYYGLSSILALFFRNSLGFAPQVSDSFVHGFVCTTFVFSILGGVIADKWLGKVKTITFSGVIWVVGSALLVWASWPDLANPGLAVPMIGIVLVGIGKGVATPVNSALLGDEVATLPKEVVSSMFARFYFFICAGSLATKFLTPFVRTHVNNFATFSMLGGVVLLAFLFFITGGLGKAKVPQCSKSNSVRFGDVARIIAAALKIKCCCCLGLSSAGENAPLVQHDQDEHASAVVEDNHWLNCVRGVYPESDIDAAKALLGVISVFATIPIFWALFFQTYSTWIFQAEYMNRNVYGYTIAPDMTQALGPLMDILIILLFNQVLYPCFQKLGRPVRPLQRIGGGMIIAMASFIVSGIVQVMVDKSPVDPTSLTPVGGVSIFWQIPQYVLISIGEIMIAVTGLEFAYSQTPRTLKSVVASLWYLTVGLGNVLVIILSLANFCGASCMMFSYAGMLAVACALFIIIALRYTYRDHLFAHTEEAKEEGAALQIEGVASINATFGSSRSQPQPRPDDDGVPEDTRFWST